MSNDIDEALIGGNKATEPGDEDESVDSSAVTGSIAFSSSYKI